MNQNLSCLYNSNKKDLKQYESIDSLMIKEKKILKYQYILSENKVSWIYVFNSKKSRWNWENLHKKYGLYFIKSLPTDLKYSQREGFLNKNPYKFSILS